MTNFTPAQLEAWAGLGPWKSQGQEPDGVYVIGLRKDKDGTPYSNPTNGLVGAALPFPTEIDSGDFTRVLANARLIAAAPDLARLVLEKEKEIARKDAEIGRLREIIAATANRLPEWFEPIETALIRARQEIKQSQKVALLSVNRLDRQAMKETSDEV